MERYDVHAVLQESSEIEKHSSLQSDIVQRPEVDNVLVCSASTEADRAASTSTVSVRHSSDLLFNVPNQPREPGTYPCLLYTSDAADE